MSGGGELPPEQAHQLVAGLDEPAHGGVGDLVGVCRRLGEEPAGDVELAEDRTEITGRHLHHGQDARHVGAQDPLLGGGRGGGLQGEPERQGAGDVAGEGAQLDQDGVACRARRERLDRGHEVEDAFVQPGAQGEHPDLDQRSFMFGARRRQVDRGPRVAHGLAGAAEVCRLTAGRDQLGDEGRVCTVGGFDPVPEGPVPGEDAGGDAVDLDAPGKRKVCRERVGEDGVGRLQPDDPVAHLRRDQTAFDRGIHVDARAEPFRDRREHGDRDGVAQYGDDLRARTHGRRCSFEGGRDGSRQRHRGIHRDLPPGRVQRLGERLAQPGEEHAQQQGGALGRLGEARRCAARDSVPQDVLGELLRVVDRERREVDPGRVRHGSGEAVEERGDAGVRPGRDDQEERLVDETANREPQRPRRRFVDPLRVIHDDAHGRLEAVDGVQHQAADGDGAVRRLRSAHTGGGAGVQSPDERLDRRVAQVRLEGVGVHAHDGPRIQPRRDVGEQGGLSEPGLAAHEHGAALEERAAGHSEDEVARVVSANDHDVIPPHDGSASRSGVMRRSVRVFHACNVARQHPFGCSPALLASGEVCPDTPGAWVQTSPLDGETADRAAKLGSTWHTSWAQKRSTSSTRPASSSTV